MKLTPLVAGLLAVAAVAAGCAHSERPASYRKTLSYGFQDGDSVYFLLDYRVSRFRRPVWFIMPIERSPLVLFHGLYLYRYEPAEEHLERLATLREAPSRRLSVRDSMFMKDGDTIVFAYRAGFDEDFRLLYELRAWDTAEQRLLDPHPEAAGNKESSLYQGYFGDYASPFVDNEGVIGISVLAREILADVDEAEWGLPRDW